MRLLVDRDIIAALQEPHPIARNLSHPLDTSPTTTSQIQAASLNFTIGDIFIPDTKPGELGGTDNPRSDYELPQGHTAVIRTRETIHLSAFRAGIGFPPAHQSMKGLLMTNPGHVDPGYSGYLHCTVINMAHRSFHLERGDPIMRVLLFELSADCSPNYPYYRRAGRPPDVVGPSPINRGLLERLSVDFVDVKKRSEEAATRQITKAQLRALWMPVVVALIAAASAYIGATLSNKDDLAKLREQFIEAKAGLEGKDAVIKLQNDIDVLKYELKIVEGAGRSQAPPNEKSQ
jgi:dCTP deaminase